MTCGFRKGQVAFSIPQRLAVPRRSTLSCVTPTASPPPSPFGKISVLRTNLAASPLLDSSSLDNKTFTPNNQGVTGVTLKLAFDSQFAVADRAPAQFERFTSPASLDLVHRLRRASDAVLVGLQTVLSDDCSLTVRRVPFKLPCQVQPTRVVIDSRLSLVLLLLSNNRTADCNDFTLLRDGLPTILYYALQKVEPDESVLQSLPDAVTLVPIEASHEDDRALSIAILLNDLRHRGLYHIMVEGGPTTARAFLQERTVDRAIIIKANTTFQEPIESLITDDTFHVAGLQLIETTLSEGDIVEYWSRPDVPWPSSVITDWP